MANIGSNNCIYLARRVPHDGWVHTILVSVWRHDPGVGPEPEVGSDLWIPQSPSPARTANQLLLVVRKSSPAMPIRSTGTGGMVPLPRIDPSVRDAALARLRTRVLSVPSTHAFWPEEPADEAAMLARAAGIYVGELDSNPPTRAVTVTEVLRHDSILGAAPAAGLVVTRLPYSQGRSPGGTVLILEMAPGTCPGWDLAPIVIGTMGRGNGVIVPSLSFLSLGALRHYAAQDDAGGGDRLARARELPMTPSVRDRLLRSEALLVVQGGNSESRQHAILMDVLHFDPALGTRPNVGDNLLDPDSPFFSHLSRMRDVLLRNTDQAALISLYKLRGSEFESTSVTILVDGYIGGARMTLDELRRKLAEIGRAN